MATKTYDLYDSDPEFSRWIDYWKPTFLEFGKHAHLIKYKDIKSVIMCDAHQDYCCSKHVKPVLHVNSTNPDIILPLQAYNTYPLPPASEEKIVYVERKSDGYHALELLSEYILVFYKIGVGIRVGKGDKDGYVDFLIGNTTLSMHIKEIFRNGIGSVIQTVTRIPSIGHNYVPKSTDELMPTVKELMVFTDTEWTAEVSKWIHKKEQSEKR